MSLSPRRMTGSGFSSRHAELFSASIVANIFRMRVRINALPLGELRADIHAVIMAMVITYVIVMMGM